ncbi:MULTISPECIES: hypothetical protein [unclassified Lysobacter]|uniref:hypothetical protein n=1 Tax=unclassified Lysobacter TaxID=2635362 RepID=UPI0006F9D874|nr:MULTISPECIES: hypothetical protein [unclassified Lysobacter]KRC35104.1 hypothetical protein ASE10_10570 [Lysobacter sp. Root76]KRD70792.1 hypothetical protein ASE45_02735 [Lysobacter sp. Root96]
MSWLMSVWNWVSGYWPWIAGSGALVGLIAFAVLNPLAAAKLASAVSGLALDALRKGVQWLRKPGNTLRATCAVLAIVAAVASVTSYQANRQIVVITKERDSALSDVSKAVGRITDLEATLATYRKQEQRYAELQRQQTEDLAEAQQDNAAALEQIRRQREIAERSSRAWWQTYAKRPDSCKAAQEAMDVACATVGEF